MNWRWPLRGLFLTFALLSALLPTSDREALPRRLPPSQGSVHREILEANPHVSLHRLAPPIAASLGRAPYALSDRNVSIFFTDRGCSFSFVNAQGKGWGLHWGLVDAARVAPRPEGERPGKVNHFRGSDPSQWRTDVPTYSRMVYVGVLPGAALTLESRPNAIEYSVTMTAGFAASRIRLRYEGATALTIDEDGRSLEVHTGLGVLREDGLVCSQSGRILPARYVDATPDGEYSIEVSDVDPSKELVIDPLIKWSSFLGGLFGAGDGTDVATDIALDANGNVYLTGYTNADFPIVGGFDSTIGGTQDAFVAKLSPTGTELLWSTYLGGSSQDAGYGIAVDSSGNVTVAGYTGSTDFPLANAFDSTLGGSGDGFFARLNPTGTALVWSSYLGGSGSDACSDVAVDGAGNAYVVGSTASTDFPSTLDTTLGGARDAFIAHVTGLGASLQWATYFGGSGIDEGAGLVYSDMWASLFVTGTTSSPDFPTSSYLDTTFGGGSDAFVARFGALSGGLVHSSYLGGSGLDRGTGVAIASGSLVHVTGTTQSADFPTTNGFDKTLGGTQDAFISYFDEGWDGMLQASTYLGGSGIDAGLGIACDPWANVYVTGDTASYDFPASSGFDPSGNGNGDAFVTRVNKYLTALLYSSYLGGMAADSGKAIAVDGGGNAHVAGETSSGDFPGGVPSAGVNAFVTKVALSGASLIWSKSLGGSRGTVGDDRGHAVAVDAGGNVYLAGPTTSIDFPVAGAFDSNLNAKDGFVAKVNADGTSLAWCSYFGGSGIDIPYGMAVDAGGNVYLTGITDSSDFPIVGALDSTLGGVDAFVAKLSAAGSYLVWSSYLGGTNWENTTRIALDGSGNVYVAGETASWGMATAGALDPSLGGWTDCFVAKISSLGNSLIWLTYLGGSGDDKANAIAVDASENVYVAGSTKSFDFPAIGGFRGQLLGTQDGFVAKINAIGTGLVWSSFLGSSNATCAGMVVDAAGSAYLTGQVDSPGLATIGAFDTIYGGSRDAFAAKVLPSGSALAWFTYLGGSSADIGKGIALNSAGDVFVVGWTQSSDFPTPNGLDQTLGASYDAFVTRLSAEGTAAVWSTYLGGSNTDYGEGLAVDAGSYVYVTGTTWSSDFPSANGFDPALTGANDAFVTRIAGDSTPPTSGSVGTAIGTSELSVNWEGFGDPESGIVEYEYAVGTTPGGTDVLPFLSTGLSTDATISMNFFTMGATYYVTIRAKNDAGLATSVVKKVVMDSTPPMAGNVYNDLAAFSGFQSSTTEVAVHWSGFEDLESGIVGYEWAIGRVPNGTEVQPFIGIGLSTAASASVSLVSGSEYCVTVRATNDAGLSSEAYLTFTVDATPPAAGPVSGFAALYDMESKVIFYANWLPFLDAESGIYGYEWAIGTTPGGGDFQPFVSVGSNPSAESAPLAIASGTTYFITVRGTNWAGLSSSSVSEGILADATPPVAGTVQDGPGADIDAQSSVATLTANWAGFADPESGIVEYAWSVGTTPGGYDIAYEYAGLATSGTVSVTLTHGTTYYVTVTAWNATGSTSSATSDGVTVDTTAPTAGIVNDGLGADLQTQSSKTTISANWTGFADPESGIASYEWAIGTYPGAANVQSFVAVGSATSATNSSLYLQNGKTYYVTVRATNPVGFKILAASNGVKVKPSGD